METLAKLTEIVESRHKAAMGWKSRTGGKVVGMMCKYIPEELIHAAGALPVFVTGTMGELDSVTEYIQENTCPYMRSCLECGLRGDYDYLDGLVVTHACDVMSKMHDFWRNRAGAPNVFLMDFPHKVNENAVPFLLYEMDRLKKHLEQLTGTEITNQALSGSIGVYNRYRDLLRKLYAFRAERPARVTGTEAFTALLATMYVRKEEAAAMLGRLLAEVGERTDPPAEGVRVLVSGTDVDDVSFYAMLEESGAAVVADDVCTGSRYFWKPVSEAGDPMESLARRYLFNFPCSRTSPSDERYDHMARLVREYGAKGIIMPVMSFCDAHCFDAPYVLDKLKGQNIPALKIEIDHTLGGLEQVRPNVEAFVEMIREGA